MKAHVQLLLLFSITALTASTQSDTSAKSQIAQSDTTLKFISMQKDSGVKVADGQKGLPAARYMGDTAPQLRVKDWIKGAPVTGFEKGKVVS
jgi:hypothetical protein